MVVTRGFCHRAAVAALLIAMPGSPVAQEPRTQADPPAKASVLRDLQGALRKNDRTWIADRIRYPLRYHGRMVAVIRNRDEFIRNYNSFVSDRLRTAILM